MDPAEQSKIESFDQLLTLVGKSSDFLRIALDAGPNALRSAIICP
ncbi:hypothetical protein [Paenibacillus glycinis]|nr:hypothetical protein [Paenibacillus glycinis]